MSNELKYRIKIADWLILILVISSISIAYIVNKNPPLRILLIGPKSFTECLYLVKDARTDTGAKAVARFCRAEFPS